MAGQIFYELKDGCGMPALGLGTWELQGKQCITTVREALDMGYRHIDTAEMYRNHREIGEAIRGRDRGEIFLTSKVWSSHLHRDDVLAACSTALSELGTDYLDLYLIHWPNPSTPLQETLQALSELRKQGKARSIGVSNFPPKLLRQAIEAADFPIVTDQIEFNPQTYDRETLQACKQNSVVLTAYSPLGRGELLADPAVVRVAAKHGKTSAQICLRWALQKGAAVIPKASNTKHLRENMDVFDWALDQQDMTKLDALT